MRNSVTIFLFSVFLALGVNVAEAQQEREILLKYGYLLLPDGSKIIPRYSKIDEVLSALGQPSDKQYFAQEQEDFYWSDFWVYTYNKILKVYFRNTDRRIIGIDAMVSRLGHLDFPFDLKETGEEIWSIVVSRQEKPGKGG